jgi:hypothetical protein
LLIQKTFMKKAVGLFLIFFTVNLFAQDSTNKKTGIITKKTFAPYKMDGRRISGEQFKQEIYKVPAAIPLYKKAKTSQIIGSSFFVPMALIAFFGDPNKRNARDTVVGRTKIRGYHVGLLLSEGGFFYFLFRSFSLYKKAIRARNSALKTIY